MKKVFILISFILLSAMAVSAQTTKSEHANSRASRDAKKTLTGNKNVRASDPRVLKLGTSTTYLNNGLSIYDVLRVLGQPTSVSERQDGELQLATYTFPRSEGRVLIAEFENGVLMSSRMETTEEVKR
jgi:hypothetical protein